ncbi:MAG TPA: TRAP transporter large permease [candidate division Zixibacteria bacterium]|nr:TRAP transporter large permease [candidate division Zixibacteria bacterium]
MISHELMVLLVMLATFAVGVFWLKIPAGFSLMLASITGALAAGEGIPVRHLVEGGFGFMEAILIIATAMVFMKVMDGSGVLGTINYQMVKTLHRWPTLLLIVITVFVMFPGMLTGLSSACILTTGALVAPGLLAMGMPRLAVGSLIAMAAVFGEVAPPICIPVMIIGGGVDMPYIGFAKPLALASFPLAITTAVYFRMRYLKRFDIQAVLPQLSAPVFRKHGIKLFIPLVFVIGYLVLEQMIPEQIPHLGVPLIFMIGAAIGFFTGEKCNWLKVSRGAIRDAMPVMSILVGVGMFLQVLTLTGVRGYLAVNALFLPESLKYAAALIMPFFGSAYAAASVIGVPLVYVFIGKNVLVITSALALLAAMGDLMPPPSLLCAYASQIVKSQNHFRILKTSAIPIVASLAVGFLIIVYASEIARLIM